MANMTKSIWQAAGVLIFAILVVCAYTVGSENLRHARRTAELYGGDPKTLENIVVPQAGVVLPANRGDLVWLGQA